MLSEPLLRMAPPFMLEKPSRIVILVSVSAAPALTTNSRRALPPLSVMTAPPSIVVFCVIVLVLASTIVAGPQLKETLPPPASLAEKSASSLQLVTTPAARAGCQPSASATRPMTGSTTTQSAVRRIGLPLPEDLRAVYAHCHGAQKR